MPCTYTGSIEGDRALASEELITELTQRLCRAFEVLDSHNLTYSLPSKDKRWWKSHKKKTRQQKGKEMKPAYVLELSAEGAAILYTALSVMGSNCLSQKLWSQLDDSVPDDMKESFHLTTNPVNGNPEVRRC